MCCTGKPGYVWVNSVGIDRIAEYLDITRREFRKRYLILAHGGYSFVEKANYDCIFLENGRCAIYSVRPRQCRTWPFWPENLKSEKAWRAEAANCPGMNNSRLYTLEKIDAILSGDADTDSAGNVFPG